QEKDESSKGKEPTPSVKRTDVQFFELVDNKEGQFIRTTIKEKVLDMEDCLKIKIETEQEIFDIRNLRK
ncbi:14478_t:CDS:1, partial [Dentiscutata heterogama]